MISAHLTRYEYYFSTHHHYLRTNQSIHQYMTYDFKSIIQKAVFFSARDENIFSSDYLTKNKLLKNFVGWWQSIYFWLWKIICGVFSLLLNNKLISVLWVFSFVFDPLTRIHLLTNKFQQPLFQLVYLDYTIQSTQIWRYDAFLKLWSIQGWYKCMSDQIKMAS